MSNYFGFAGAGEIDRAGAISLLDSFLPQDDVEIVVPQTMESPGLIELYNWLDVEFTGIETSTGVLEHLRLLATDGHKTILILLRDDEHPEQDILRDAFNAGISVLDLNQSLHPIEYKPPAESPKRGRRRRAEVPEPGSADELAAYQDASNEIREAMGDVSVEEAAKVIKDIRKEQAARREASEDVVEAQIAGPATTSPVWDERFKAQSLMEIEDLDQLGNELLGTLMVIIRRMVTQEVGNQMVHVSPGVRATTENFTQSPVTEPAETAVIPEEKLPYLHNKETGKYISREGKKGRPPKGSEVVYLTASEVGALEYKGLIENLEVQLELPFG